MTSRAYAQALYALDQEGTIANLPRVFATYLKEKGKIHLLPPIILELERLKKRGARQRTCEVLYGQHGTSEEAVREGQEFLKREIGDTDVESWSIIPQYDKEVIGGYAIRTPELLHDSTDRTALYTLYERLRTA